MTIQTGGRAIPDGWGAASAFSVPPAGTTTASNVLGFPTVGPRAYLLDNLPLTTSWQSSGFHAASTGAIASRDQQREYYAILSGRLRYVCLTVIPNTSEGSNLSLISALLQIAGVRLKDVQQYACQVLDELTGRPDSLGSYLKNGGNIYAHPQAFHAVTTHIFGEGHVPTLPIMMAGEGGAPLLWDPLKARTTSAIDPATVPNDAIVLLWGPTGTFEAVSNTSGRPWPAVLGRLQMRALYDSESERNAAWVVHCVQATRPINVRTFDVNGTSKTYRWKRGIQNGLVLLDNHQNLSPLMRARAMAEAQAVVDSLWPALEREYSFDLEQMPPPAAEYIHWMAVPPTIASIAVMQQNMEDATTPSSGQANGAICPRMALRVNQGRLIDLTLYRSGQPYFLVKLENPWSRNLHMFSRRKLIHPDDMDTFDPLALKFIKPQDRAILADFLVHMRQRWEDGVDQFRKWSRDRQELYLCQQVATREFRSHDPAVVRRAFSMPAPAPAMRGLGLKLWHDDDRAAFGLLGLLANKIKNASYFHAFMIDLRHETRDGVQNFLLWSDEQRNQHLEKARRRLSSNVMAVVEHVVSYLQSQRNADT